MPPTIVLQFKVALREVEPQVWRRFQTPAGYSFWDLHVAIQDAMGWQDSHLHEFRVKKSRGRKVWKIGIPDDETEDTLAGWVEPVYSYFKMPGDVTEYVYDFGDYWQHELVLEGLLLAEPGTRYPRCLAGARACPPEDCGGPHGYQEMLKVLGDPGHDEYEDYVTWLGGQVAGNRPFDAGLFDATAVIFENPRKRFRYAFDPD